MNAIVNWSNSLAQRIDYATDGWLVPTLARIFFAGVLLVYFWASAVTKLGDGPLGFIYPSDGAYIQIFPKYIESIGYDFSQLTTYHYVVVLAGMWAEFLLPLFIVIGLFTRLAAFGMIIFVIVQSLTDIFGHGADAATIGMWFDRIEDSKIVDQRSLWILLFLTLVIKGGGPFSIDRFLFRSDEDDY